MCLQLRRFFSKPDANTSGSTAAPKAVNNPPPTNKDANKLSGKHIMSCKGATSPYVIEKWVAGGGFGQIFLGHNKNTKKRVAIKLERMDAPQRQLYLEFGFYMRLGKDCIYAPQIYYFGAVDNWNALVMELLGPSLLKIQTIVGKFSAACMAAVGISLLEIFRDFHDKGLIFRDVKPENFLLGLPNSANAHLIFMIDLGLCKEWRQENGEHIPFATQKCLTGTPQYISVNMHQTCELSRRDDLESIMYMLVYLKTGTLPWLVADKKYKDDWMKRMAAYGEIKLNITPEELCAKMPSHFTKVFKRVRKLAFTEDPDYAGYINSFVSILAENHINLDDFIRAYDWNQAHKKRAPRVSKTKKSGSSRNRSVGKSRGSVKGRSKSSNKTRSHFKTSESKKTKKKKP